MQRSFLIGIVVAVQIGVIAFLVHYIHEQRVKLGTNAPPVVSNDFVPPDAFAHISPYELPNFHESEHKQSHFDTPGQIYVPDWLSDRPRVTLNADELHNTKDYSVEKPDDVFRIVTLGDSFTFGLYVHTEETYPSQLEVLLNERCEGNITYEVLNLGVSGYDLEHSVHRFIARGEKYDANLVLFFLLLNDLREIREAIYEIELEQLAKYAEKDERGNPIIHTLPLDLRNEVYQETIKYFYDAYDLGVLQTYQRIVLELFGEHYTNDLLFYTVPVGGKIDDNLFAPVTEFAASRPRTYIYRSGVELPVPTARFAEGHPSKEGYARIADDLFEYLIERKLVPCQTDS